MPMFNAVNSSGVSNFFNLFVQANVLKYSSVGLVASKLVIDTTFLSLLLYNTILPFLDG